MWAGECRLPFDYLKSMHSSFFHPCDWHSAVSDKGARSFARKAGVKQGVKKAGCEEGGAKGGQPAASSPPSWAHVTLDSDESEESDGTEMAQEGFEKETGSSHGTHVY